VAQDRGHAEGREALRQRCFVERGVQDDVLNDTEQIQRRINELYHPVPPLRTDGIIDDLTVAAYKKHQLAIGLTGADADGYPGNVSVEALGFRHE
jgi:hypothetical protein